MLTFIWTSFVTDVETDRFLAEKTTVYRPGVVGVPVTESVLALKVIPAGRPVALTVGLECEVTTTGMDFTATPGS